MKTFFSASVLAMALTVATFAASTLGGDLKHDLFIYIKTAKNITEAEQNSSRLLKEFANSPDAIGQIHANMAFREQNASPLDPERVIQRCQNALKFPLTMAL